MPISDAIGGLLRAAAPTVLTALALPPPLNIVASAVVSGALSRYLPQGEAPATTQGSGAPALSPQQVERIVAANAGDPKFMLDLRQAEIDLQRYETEAGIRFAELATKERERAGSFQRETGIAMRTFRAGMVIVTLALSGLMLVVAGIVALLLGAVRVPAGSADLTVAGFGLIGTIVGFLNGHSASIIAFYWGSSQGSADKSEAMTNTMRDMGAQLGRAVSALPPPQPTPVVVTTAPPSPPPPVAPVPTESRFNSIIADLLRDEGGYVDHPSDPGGCTNMGITLATLAGWRGPNATVTCEDVAALTEQEARQIYFAKYWNALQADMLPAGLDYMVFDFGVNAGVSRSAKLLQTCLRKRDATLAVDGVVGPLTLAAVAKAAPKALIDEFHSAKMEFYRSLGTWGTFGRGWTNRAERVLAAAHGQAAAAATRRGAAAA